MNQIPNHFVFESIVPKKPFFILIFFFWGGGFSNVIVVIAGAFVHVEGVQRAA